MYKIFICITSVIVLCFVIGRENVMGSDIGQRTQKIPQIDYNFRSVPSVCSWCGTIYNISKWPVVKSMVGKRFYTHGLCVKCRKKITKEIDEKYGLNPMV